MFKKIISCISLVFFLHFLIGCATIGSPEKDDTVDYFSPAIIEAREFNEIKIQTTDRNSYKAKIIRFEKGYVTFLPFPYWNIDLMRIPIQEIHSIDLMKKKSNPGKAFAYGFGGSFLFVGLLAALVSKYDEDYQMGLAGSAVIGGAIGLLSAAISGLSSVGEKTKFEFIHMSDKEKSNAVREIMGHKPLK